MYRMFLRYPNCQLNRRYQNYLYYLMYPNYQTYHWSLLNQKYRMYQMYQNCQMNPMLLRYRM
jgi:hypothetical protein